MDQSLVSLTLQAPSGAVSTGHAAPDGAFGKPCGGGRQRCPAYGAADGAHSTRFAFRRCGPWRWDKLSSPGGARRAGAAAELAVGNGRIVQRGETLAGGSCRINQLGETLSGRICRINQLGEKLSGRSCRIDPLGAPWTVGSCRNVQCFAQSVVGSLRIDQLSARLIVGSCRNCQLIGKGGNRGRFGVLILEWGVFARTIFGQRMASPARPSPVTGAPARAPRSRSARTSSARRAGHELGAPVAAQRVREGKALNALGVPHGPPRPGRSREFHDGTSFLRHRHNFSQADQSLAWHWLNTFRRSGRAVRRRERRPCRSQAARHTKPSAEKTL